MAWGKRRSKKEIAEIKLAIIGFIAKGYERPEIRLLMEKGNLKLPSRTFDRYYSELITEEAKALTKAGVEKLVKFVKRSEARQKEALLRYRNTKDVQFLNASHKFDKDTMNILIDTGIIKKAAEKIKLDAKFDIPTKQALEILRKMKRTEAAKKVSENG